MRFSKLKISQETKLVMF